LIQTWQINAVNLRASSSRKKDVHVLEFLVPSDNSPLQIFKKASL
jgi:hypothetical protein